MVLWIQLVFMPKFRRIIWAQSNGHKTSLKEGLMFHIIFSRITHNNNVDKLKMQRDETSRA